MTFNPEAPKWTAYILGELDADAQAAVEAELAASPDAQQYVDELRRTIELVSAGLAAEPNPAAGADLTETVLASAEIPPAEAAAEPVEATGGEPIDDASAINEIAAGTDNDDDWSPGEVEVAHPVRPAGHIRAGGRLPWLALAASLLAVVALGGFLLSGGGQLSQAILAMRQGRSVSEPKPRAKSDDGDLGDPIAERALLAPQSWSGRTDADPRSMEVEYFDTSAPPDASTEMGTDTLMLETPTDFARRAGDGDAFEEAGGGMGAASVVTRETAPAGAQSLGRAAGPSVNGSAEPKQARGSRGEGFGSRGNGVRKALLKPSHSKRSEMGEPIHERVEARGGTFGSYPSAATNDRETTNGAIESPRGFGYYPKQWRRWPESEEANDDHSAEAYESITDNAFLPVAENPLSTFSTDVDTAAYSIVRRYLQQNHQLPPRSAVRIEELVNYFPYDYPQPADGKPIAASAELAPCPWHSEHRLLRVGIKARDVAPAQRPLTNLVFLVDVSGSMQSPDKLPLVKESLRLLTNQMGENDHVAIVVYAGNSGLALSSTSGVDQAKIRAALDALEAGGSTNGAGGIQQAYDVAQENFVKGGVNRVILATDGDFNVGITDRGDLVHLIEEKAASGVFLTTLGFGMGNLKDATLEQLADKGNGNYAYIDNLREAKKVLVEQMSGTLVTVAKDVKIQIEFNPARVASFRLIGYENRILRHEEFNDDRKDAGDIGAGHTVTALYELVPVAQQVEAKAENQPGVDALKYQQRRTLTAAADSLELLTLKLRYKQPDAAESQLVEYPVKDTDQTLAQASADFKFAAAVAEFGMLLRDSPHKGNATFDAARELAQTGRGSDNAGYRAELIDLIGTAAAIQRESNERK